MGRQNGLTHTQQLIFTEASKDSFIASRFYFTGGTALSAFYLHHRLSEDLDFFSIQKFESEVIFTKMDTWAKKYKADLSMREIDNINIFNLVFKNGENLKVDFVHYPHSLLEKGITHQNISIDSKLDIAVNKLLVIMQRTQVKDFVDLYFLFKEYTLWDLIPGVYAKFRVKTDPLLIASDFAKVNDFTFLPTMIIPLSLDELKSFFMEKAKELAKTAVE